MNNKANEMFEELYGDIAKMGRHIAKQYRVTVDEDYLQECYASAWEALLAFDPSRGVKPQTLIFQYLRNAMFKHLRNTLGRTFRGEANISMYTPMYDQELKDYIPCMDDTFDTINSELSYQEIIGSLDERERTCVKMKLAQNTQTEIAQHLGMKQPHVSRIMSGIKMKFDHMDNAG